MQLYLVRHGNALSKDAHPERPLSDEGRMQASKMASFIKPQRIEVEAIWQSGKARALQTAEIMAASAYSRDGIVEHSGLAPNDPVKPIARELKEVAGDLMIVGHLPFMDRLASILLAGAKEQEFVCFDEATVACLERDGGGEWVLLWLLSPQLVA